MPKKNSAATATSKQPAAKRLSKKAAEAIANHWPERLIDALPDSVSYPIDIIESIVDRSTDQPATIGELQLLIDMLTGNEVARFVAMLRLSSYKPGFLEGALEVLMPKGKGRR